MKYHSFKMKIILHLQKCKYEIEIEYIYIYIYILILIKFSWWGDYHFKGVEDEQEVVKCFSDFCFQQNHIQRHTPCKYYHWSDHLWWCCRQNPVLCKTKKVIIEEKERPITITLWKVHGKSVDMFSFYTKWAII